MLNLTGFKKFEQDLKLVKRILFLEQEWSRAYPLVDLQKQLGWAHAWLITSGKQYRDMGRFLNNWFRRCQQDLEKAQYSTGPIQMPKYKEQRPHEADIMTADDIHAIKVSLRSPKKDRNCPDCEAAIAKNHGPNCGEHAAARADYLEGNDEPKKPTFDVI